MKRILSSVTALVLVFSIHSQAQAQSKAKGRAKTKATKSVKALPKKEVSTTEITPEMITPPVVPATEVAPDAPVISPTAAENAPSPVTPQSDVKPDTSDKHLFGFSGALGLPHPLRLGIDYVHSSRYFSVELGYGVFGITANDVTFGLTNMEAGLRWHPFAGSFFLGALLGNRKISAEKTETISGQPVKAKVEVSSNYMAPYLGWMWGGSSSGVFVSMDFGYLSPSGPASSFTTDASAIIQGQQEYQTLDADVRKSGRDLGEIGMPIWTMLRFGYLF